MSPNVPVLLIIDYNLSRIAEVFRMRNYAHVRWGAETWLIRSNPQALDLSISDAVFDVDPLSADFVERAIESLGPHASRISAGLVFSDNAVASGAALLERLGLPVDDASKALSAFDKYVYRTHETAQRSTLEGMGVLVPDFSAIHSVEDVLRFADRHRQGFVIKPMCEGNNRGVVLVGSGDDPASAFCEVAPYVEKGVLAEQLIPYRREFSHDGLGSLTFITEKISADGRYPVEIAQVLPARLNDRERQMLLATGEQINHLIGQARGPFHNEIKLNEDGTRAAVVEPNRRPAGMKIWSLARWVYDLDLFETWIDSVFGVDVPTALNAPTCTAATVMLGVPRDMEFEPHDITSDHHPFTYALLASATLHGLNHKELVAYEFTWLGLEKRHIRRVPRDNSDFAAQVCIVLHVDRVDIRDVIQTLRAQWLMELARLLPGQSQRIAS